MPDEYISREAALKALFAPGMCYAPMQLQIIKDLPAADVAQVVHGQWESGNPICPVCGENKFKDLDADIWCDWKPAFRPNCGARMDGGNGA